MLLAIQPMNVPAGPPGDFARLTFQSPKPDCAVAFRREGVHFAGGHGHPVRILADPFRRQTVLRGSVAQLPEEVQAPVPEAAVLFERQAVGKATGNDLPVAVITNAGGD